VKLSKVAGKDMLWILEMLEGGRGREKPAIEHLPSLPFTHWRDDGQH